MSTGADKGRNNQFARMNFCAQKLNSRTSEMGSQSQQRFGLKHGPGESANQKTRLAAREQHEYPAQIADHSEIRIDCKFEQRAEPRFGEPKVEISISTRRAVCIDSRGLRDCKRSQQQHNEQVNICKQHSQAQRTALMRGKTVVDCDRICVLILLVARVYIFCSSLLGDFLDAAS